VGEDTVDESNDLTLDFAPCKVTNDNYRLKRYVVTLELPQVLKRQEIDIGDSVYGISTEGRDRQYAP
jgi:hypothetical protein